MTTAPNRGPSRRGAVRLALLAAVVAVAGIVAAAFFVADLVEQSDEEGLRASDVTVELARATAPVPSYWFGRTAPGGARLDRVRPAFDPATGTLRFSYGVDCPAGGAGCTTQASIRTTGDRRIDGLDTGEDCWRRSAAAYVHWCARDANGRPSREVHLFAGDRMTELRVGAAAASGGTAAPAPIPWPRLEPRLERFDRPDGRRFPAAEPLTCEEFRSGDAGQRRAVPPALRPAERC